MNEVVDVCVLLLNRHGKIQSVKLISSSSSSSSTTKNGPTSSVHPAGDNGDVSTGADLHRHRGGGSAGGPPPSCAVVAFMDIRSASRAHDSVNVINGTQLVTLYNESSTSVTVPSTASSLIGGAGGGACPSSAAAVSGTGCPRMSPAAGFLSLRITSSSAHQHGSSTNSSLVSPSSRHVHRPSDGLADRLIIYFSSLFYCQQTSFSNKYDREYI